MPPRANRHSRNTRSTSRDAEPVNTRPFVRPHLPPLSGTPSSRRQYTYGSGVEPPPRTSHHFQHMDLQNAVDQALERTVDEELQYQISQSEASNHSGDEDVDASDTEQAMAPPENRPVRNQATNLSSQFSAVDDDDSMRSFQLESDFYGEATIMSTAGFSSPARATRATASRIRQQVSRNVPEPIPEESPQKAPNPRPASANQSRSRPTERPLRRDPGRPPRLGTGAPEVKGESPIRPEVVVRDHQDEVPAGSDSGSPSPMPRRRAERRPRVEEEPAQQPESVQEPEEQALRPQRAIAPVLGGPTLQPPSSAMTVPAPTKQRRPGSRSSAARREADNTAAQQNTRIIHEQEQPEDRPQEQTRTSQQNDAVLGTSESRERLSRTTRDEPSENVDLSRSANLKGTGDSSAELPAPSERDAEIQQAILEAEDQVDDQADTEGHKAQALQERMEARRQRWHWVLSFWPFTVFPDFIRRQRERENTLWNLDDWANGYRFPFREFYNPLTYLNLAVRFVDWIFDLALAYEIARRRSGRSAAWTWVFGGAFVCILGVLIALFLGPTGSVSVPSWTLDGMNWPSFMPSISWSSDRLNNLADLWETDDDDDKEQKARQILKRFEKDLAQLKKGGGLHDASLQKLQTIVPKIVRMELKDGKPVVSQEFWHALRDLINKDEEFLTVEKSVDGYQFTSDEQWRAIIKRLNQDPAFAKKLESSVDGIEGRLGDRLDKKMVGAWDSWVSNNNDKISQLLGKALDKIQTLGSGKEFDKRLAELIKEQLQGKDVQEVIVTRKEFLRHLQNDFATHRSEIRGELDHLEAQIDRLKEAMDLAAKNKGQGVTKGEVGDLVQNLVRKTMADMNLGSLAKGKIHSHWDAELRNQINYFAMGSGATIDGVRTSNVYDPLEKGDKEPTRYASGIRGLKVLPPIAALHQWDGDGDCFCAVRSTNRRGNPHGATLSVQLGYPVIPQHIVVEHILPGATIDPAARPRDIEIWAHYDDHDLRSRVQDFSATHFAPDPDDRDAMDPNYGAPFVKIGSLVYQDTELHDGVHVHRLSSQLQELKAATDQVIIRAVSNYGASDHTCFYRVRLYGKEP